jgi:hypothetical protein
MKWYILVGLVSTISGALGAVGYYEKQIVVLEQEVTARLDVAYECVVRLKQTEKILDTAITQLEDFAYDSKMCEQKLKFCIGVKP